MEGHIYAQTVYRQHRYPDPTPAHTPADVEVDNTNG